MIEPDKDGAPTKSGLAKDWSVGSDGKSLTFKLREGVKFHDGTEFNAAAVKFNIERISDPASKSPFREYYAAVASVEVVDNLTVRFNLSRPDVLVLARMTDAVGGMMVSPAAVKKYGVDFPRNPVGTGPFQFEEWVADRVTVKRFEGYWKKDQDGNQLPYLDRVVHQLITDPSTMVANLRTGQIDLSNRVSGEQIPLVKNDPNLTYESRPGLGTQGLAMNTKRAPFDKKALRQAVALAVDREGMARIAGGTAWASIINPIDKAYDDGKSALLPARDVAKAKAKMAEAGYPAGGLKVKYTTTNDPLNMNIAQISKANLAEIGIEAEIEAFAFATWNTKVRSDFDYQMTSGVGSGMNPTVGDPGHYLANQLHSRGSRNFFGPYSNPQVDQLLDKALETYDQKARAALYNEAGKLIAEDVPFVPFLVEDTFLFWNKKVRNVIKYWDPYQHSWDMWLAQ